MEILKEDLKKIVPSTLKEQNLQINETKPEEYVTKRGGEETWKDCKYLRSFLDTDKDINRRKILSTNTYNQLKYIYDNKKTSKQTKLRLFKSHIESLSTYNCELWTLIKNTKRPFTHFKEN